MARIRSIKPELPRDAKLAKLPREVRYTFILLLTQVDDDGLFVATPRALLGAVYPHDSDLSEGDLVRELDRMRSIGLLKAYTTPDGVVGEIVNFKKHQKIDNRSKAYLATLSREPRETFGVGVLSLESRVLSQESGPTTTAREAFVPDIADPERTYVTGCCLVANHALSDLLAGTYKPIVAAVECADGVACAWFRDGIPAALAHEVIGHRTRGFKVGQYNRQPMTLKYFDGAVREAFEKSRAAGPLTPAEEIRAMRLAAEAEDAA